VVGGEVFGVVDTACDSSVGFTGTQCSSGIQSKANTLTLEGIVYSAGGFNLERVPASGAGESFVGRLDFLLSAISVFGKNGYSWKENIN